MTVPFSHRTSSAFHDSLQDQPRKGVVYTRHDTVELCLNIARRNLPCQLLGARVLDIGCGFGQFSVPVAAEILREASAVGRKRDVEAILRTTLRGIEIRPSTAERTRGALATMLWSAAGLLPTASDLETMIQCADFLTWEPDNGPFDLIVGNLPYVRHDEIRGLSGTLDVRELRHRFTSFRGRADYSVPVLERALELLSPKGVAVLITSNRFTRSDYGVGIRKILAGSPWEVHEIDLAHVRAFRNRCNRTCKYPHPRASQVIGQWRVTVIPAVPNN